MEPLHFPFIASIVAGVLIFVMPKLLNYIVAIYLILFGILGLLPAFLGQPG
jgi:hypothetical protein